MEEKITLNLIYIGLVSALAAVLLTSFAFFNTYEAQSEVELSRYAGLIADAYEAQPTPVVLEGAAGDNERILLADAGGAILFDSFSGAADTDVLSWPEVRQALAEGEGSDRRNMPDRQGTGAYCAIVLEDGNLLCVSSALPSFWSMFSQSFGYIIIIFLILVPLAFLFSLLLTRRLIRPINALPEQLSKPNFNPEQAEIYPELIPLMKEITERRNERETMRQEFTANVSHELKTPLTTISGYSEMIASGLAKPEDIQRFAAKIHTESERMQNLVGDIIELSAMDSEVTHQHSDQVDFLALVQDCVEQLAPHFAAKHLSVYITGGGFTMMGNQRQLWELVYNLLDNARRYNVDGGMIRIFVEDHVLSVQDTGIGIAKEHQARVFERFYRVDKSHSRATGGTGLGLSIVKHVAELHGAELELESTEHIGTEIRVRFPA